MQNISLTTLDNSVQEYLDMYNCHSVYLHCLEVGNYAHYLAQKYLEQPQKAQIAGLLHDISAVYPNEKRIEVANKMKIHLCKEEKDLPMIIHQKLSKEMAKTKFNITDKEVLSAIECHTTLKPNYSKLDLVLFVADKVKWDQPGNPPYLEGLMDALNTSLESAAYYYITYILNNDIKVAHPWLLAAYKELKSHD